MRDTLFLATLAILAPACASGGGSRRSSCEIAPADSVYLEAGPVFRPCAVDIVAEALNPRVPIDFRPADRRTCYSGEVRFVVDASGLPEAFTARVVRTSSQDLAEAMLRIISQLRYRPARKDGGPVRQITTWSVRMGIVLGGGSQRAPKC